ncbi:DUF4397 domain-containing protein [Syntrophomonas curvata]
MPTINSFIRFLHVSPGAPAVDVYADENLVFQNVAYNEISEYLVVGPEDIHIEVFPAGEKSNPLIDTNVNIPPSERITIAMIGAPTDLSLLPIFLPGEPITTDDGRIRFAHLSPGAPDMSLAVENGPQFDDVAYTQVTDFETIAPGTYNLKLRWAGEDEVLLKETLRVQERTAYTVYAAGLLDGEPPLEISFYQDQIPYIGNAVKETKFRKEVIRGKAPLIKFVYSPK